MAKQTGIIKVRGTVGGITFYKLNGDYYARKKTSLNKERVLRDVAFAGSRRSSGLFGTAAKIAKVIYRRLPVQKKGHGVIGMLTSKANRMLHEGMPADDALELLLEKYVGASAKVMLEQPIQVRQVEMCKEEDVVRKESGDVVFERTKGVCRQDYIGIWARSG